MIWVLLILLASCCYYYRRRRLSLGNASARRLGRNVPSAVTVDSTVENDTDSDFPMRDAAAVFPLNDTERELFKDLPPDYEVALGPPPAYEETAGSRRQELPIDQPPPDYTPD